MEEASVAKVLDKFLKVKPLSKRALQRLVKAVVVSAPNALLVLQKIVTKPEDLAAVVEDGELLELQGLKE